MTGFCALPFIYLLAPAATLLLWPAGRLVALSNWLVTWFAKLPLIRFHAISTLDMLLFLATMTIVTFVRNKLWRWSLGLSLPVLAVIIHQCVSPSADGRLRVTMLSVGQGESLFVRLPGGHTMLVDGGGYLHETGRDFGERTLAPALFKLGVRRIDRMVLTHSHPDHSGGLPFTAGVFPLGEFCEGSVGGSGTYYNQLHTTLSSLKVPVRRLSAGDTLELERGVMMTVLSPPRELPRHSEQVSDEVGMNEDSLVFRLSFGATSMLFTADAGFFAENRMLQGGANLRSTVLKVGHHGSRYSTSDAFLDSVSPKIALISAGRGNSFGLPASQTVRRLEQRGIRTYRTDLDGSIELVSDGTAWSVATPYRNK